MTDPSRRGRADEIDGELWGGNCIRCDWSVSGIGSRQDVIDYAIAHRERVVREDGELSDGHNVAVQDTDGDHDGFAFSAETLQNHDASEYAKGTCERKGCKNEGVRDVSMTEAMEHTPHDEPAPEIKQEELELVLVCAQCSADYNYRTWYGDGSSVSSFLKTEKVRYSS